MISAETIADVTSRFAVRGRFAESEPLAGGHINESYIVTLIDNRGRGRFVLQRLNPGVFRQPERVMENIRRVTAHLAERLRDQGADDVDRRVIPPIPSRDGRAYVLDETGGCWRLCRFIEGSRVHPAVESPQVAHEAGRAFGEFQRLLSDLPGPRLYETIPAFHDTPLRYEALERAVEADPLGRAASANAEIEFARSRRGFANVLRDLHAHGAIAERIVHNDAKITNVLFDAGAERAICVVDLDTVMPGLGLYDFGDMVRSMTCPAAEDERDLSRVELREELFEAVARGYSAGAGDLLTPTERKHLVAAGKLITLEQGVRFLTDYLEGDRYYQTRRTGQNLDRCRTQFKLVASIERQQQSVERVAAQA